MKTDSKNKQQKREEVSTNLENEPREKDENATQDFPLNEKGLEQELEENKQVYNELNDQYLRLAADFENFKKRVAKEKADLISYGNEELIKSLLNVIDNLERAIEHSELNQDSEPIVEGIRLVHKQFLDCLDKFGVKTINVKKGDEFDPNLHQAVERLESSEVEPGLILSEMLRGYTLKDRLLRPALVSVSKGKDEASSDKAKIDSILTDKKANGDAEDMSEIFDSDLENS